MHLGASVASIAIPKTYRYGVTAAVLIAAAVIELFSLNSYNGRIHRRSVNAYEKIGIALKSTIIARLRSCASTRRMETEGIKLIKNGIWKEATWTRNKKELYA